MWWYGMVICSMMVCSSSLVMAVGCDADGDIRLDFAENVETVNQKEYRLIQVCLFGQWSYVCNWNFDHQDVDSSVVLQQFQCQNGGKDVPVLTHFTTSAISYNYTRNYSSYQYLKPHPSVSNPSDLFWS